MGLRGAGLDDLAQHIVNKGGNTAMAEMQRRLLLLDPAFAPGLGVQPVFSEPVDTLPPTAEEALDPDQVASPYFLQWSAASVFVACTAERAVGSLPLTSKHQRTFGR